MEPICLQGRTLSSDDLAAVRALMAEHPHWHRTALSRHLCELWHWRNEAGRLKDLAARTLLLKLHVRGWIELPPPRKRTRRPCAPAPPTLSREWLPLAPAPILSRLELLQPVGLELAHTPDLRRRVRQLLAQYHYRGFHGAVGENVQYLARDAQGQELAVMVFGAAAWKVTVRDQFIGWSAPQRSQRLGRVANQQRFLMLDRWGIEVNHRDEKEILGVGEAQVWNENSVSQVPALLVAMYSWLLLAGLECYGPQRTSDYEPLPKWRRGAKRPSCLDLVTLLRKQLAENPVIFATGTAAPNYATMVGAAAA